MREAGRNLCRMGSSGPPAQCIDTSGRACWSRRTETACATNPGFETYRSNGSRSSDSITKACESSRGYRLDVLVANLVLVELKSVNKLKPIHHAQLLTYLRLTGLPVGLLLNFNVRVLREGIRRVVNNL